MDSKLAEAASWGLLLDEARRRGLSGQEARWIAEEAADQSFAELAAHLDERPTTGAAGRFTDLVAARSAGEPLQYVLGHWQFRGLDLLVDRRALIPRPETEVVAGEALAELRRTGSPRCALLVVELGTGSGAIACSLAAEDESVRVVATERSEEALELAGMNRARMPSELAARILLRRGSWFEALEPQLTNEVSLVVSNPPYVAASEWDRLDPAVRDFEPYEALVSGPRGSEAIEEILRGAPAWLRPKGAVVSEIAPHQKEVALALASEAGAAEAEVRPDLAGRPRVLIARW